MVGASDVVRVGLTEPRGRIKEVHTTWIVTTNLAGRQAVCRVACRARRSRGGRLSLLGRSMRFVRGKRVMHVVRVQRA